MDLIQVDRERCQIPRQKSRANNLAIVRTDCMLKIEKIDNEAIK